MKKIACFFVNYNNSEKSIECIESFVNQLANNYHVSIFIVDNNSAESEKRILEAYAQRFKSEKVSYENIFLKENIGYFPALNEVYLLQKKLVDTCDYVVIGNNDLIFSESFLVELEKKKYNEDVFVVSPNIINSDDNHQNPQIIHKYSKLQLLYLDLYHSSYFIACFLSFISIFVKYRGSQKSKSGNNESQYISIGYGACYVLMKKFSSKIGHIPSYLFLMNEENALTNLVLNNNGRIYYDAELLVNHMEHSAINLSPKRKMYRIVQESYKISKKHFNNKYLFDKKINIDNG